MLYIVVHYFDYGCEAKAVYTTTCLESARRECARYGNNEDMKEGYEIRDGRGDLVR